MSSGSRAARLALLTLAVVGASAVLLAPASAAGVTGAVGPGAAAVDDDDPLRSNTSMEIQLRPNGDARWTVTARYDLTDDAHRDAFVELANAYERGETESLGLPAFREARESASRSTGRPMGIRNVVRSSSSSAEVANGTGRLTLSFTWTNFARVDGERDRLIVDDAFTTADGTWLQSLGPGQTLTITPPEGYSPFTGTGDVTEGQFRWEGRQAFGPGSPRAVFTRGGGEPPANSLFWIGLGLAGLVLVLALVFLLASRRELPGDFGEDGDAPAAAAEATGTEQADGDAAPADGTEADATAGDGDDGVDVALLSDEERVESLLERNGGRMKQASIVKETGWSNAKVSQLLSAMEEADRIDKLRIGRENLISFPDEDVADVQE